MWRFGSQCSEKFTTEFTEHIVEKGMKFHNENDWTGLFILHSLAEVHLHNTEIYT